MNTQNQRYALALALLWELFFPFVILYSRLSTQEHTQLIAGGAIFLLLFIVLWSLHPYLLAGALVLDALLTIIFAHIVLVWGVEGLVSRFHVLLEASPNESREYIQQFILHQPSTYLILTYIVVLALLLILGTRKHNTLPLSLRAKEALLALLALTLLGIKVLGITAFRPSVEVIQRSISAYHDLTAVKQRETWLREHPLPPEQCASSFDKIIIVIGESANRDFLQIYGYPLPTTPFFQSLQQRGTFVQFRAISPANLTRGALPLILTKATVHDPKAFLHSHSIVGTLGACGYQTFWLSNQELTGRFTHNAYTMGAEADFLAFTTTGMEHRTTLPFDEALLTLLKPDMLAPPGTKQAFFFHLDGSHVNYKERYPPDAALIPSPSDLLEEYVNSIHYTDTVIQRIVAAIQPSSRSLLLIYLSDHGEYVTPNHSGHAFSSAYQDEFRIPFILWTPTPHQPQLTAIRMAAKPKCGFLNSESLPSIVDFLVGRDTLHLSTETAVLRLGLYPADYLTLPVIRNREIVGNYSILYGEYCKQATP